MLSLCVIVVCVRRREEEEEKEPGIQNQKQEPHTKLWGIKHKVVSPQWCERWFINHSNYRYNPLINPSYWTYSGHHLGIIYGYIPHKPNGPPSSKSTWRFRYRFGTTLLEAHPWHLHPCMMFRHLYQIYRHCHYWRLHPNLQWHINQSYNVPTPL